MESEAVGFIWIEGGTSGSINGTSFYAFSQVSEATYGLKIGASAGCTFGCYASGSYTSAAFDASNCSNSTFIGCSGTNSGGPVWLLPTAALSAPAYWDRCDIDGALPLSYFPNYKAVPDPASAIGIGTLMRCATGDTPVWNSGTSTSNVGKPIIGSGTNNVLARWSIIQTLAATASWTTSTPNITMTANPGNVTARMGVYNATTKKHVGTVSTFVGTALVLDANAASASSGSTDTLVFLTWVIAGP
jgi:hypothetical protein